MSQPRVSTTRFILPVLTGLAAALLALPALAGSQARIVRLSDVQGSVQIDKNTGLGFERALLNLPITQGTQLQTSANGRAEIEFEDGSALRLAPNSKVEFSMLGLSDAGKRVSVVNLVQGMAYINWLSKSDDFTLNFSHEKVQLASPAHFRVETSNSNAKLAVFKGDVAVDGAYGNVTVTKKKMATFDAGDGDKFSLAKLEEDPLDSWDKEASEYHQQYAKNNSSPYGYGYSDLSYYGGFRSVSGYGMMWQPYFAGVGWDPFMDGAWSFYPGFGYMYVSAYPWGWLPYRYGNWMFVPGYGWMWQPGAWSTFNVVPRISGPTPTRFQAPVAPKGTGTTIAVGRGPMLSAPPVSRLIVNGSAGMGIARGSLGNLNRLNGQVAKSGRVEVPPAPQFANTASARNLSASQPALGSAMGPGASRSAASAPAGRSAPPPASAPHTSGGAGHRN
jgi:hypothetical protein